MKLSIRKNKTLVSLRKAWGIAPTWIPNDRFWSKIFGNVAPNVTSQSADKVLGTNRLLPGNIVAIGNKGLSLVFELPAGYRTIRVSNSNKYTIQHNGGVVEDFEVWVPTMLVYVQYTAARRLGSMSVFFIKKTDLDFTDPQYYDQAHYLPPFPNQYRSGAFCLPDDHIIAPDKSFNSLVNTAVEAIFGTTFNYDMGGMPETLKRDTKLYDRSRHKSTLTALFKRWRKMTPEEVDQIPWMKCHWNADHIRGSYKIPLNADPFAHTQRFWPMLEAEASNIAKRTNRSTR